MEKIKEFVRSTTSPSLIVRLQGLETLKTTAKQIDLGVEVVKYCIHKLGEKMFIYSDGILQKFSLDILRILLSKYREVAVETLTTVLSINSQLFKNVSGSKSQAKLALVALKWVNLLLEYSILSSILLEILSILLAAIPDIPATKGIWEKARHYVFHLFSSNPSLPLRCLELVLAATGPFNFPYLVLLSAVFAFFRKNESTHPFPSELYVRVIKLFASSVLSSRVCPDELVIKNCADLFMKVTHQIFQDYLLPAMLKALLRNPEELIKTMTFVLGSVPIDLSPYAVDILKKVLPHINSQRSQVLELLLVLARQCSDPSYPKEAQQLLTSALKCSPVGKQTVAEYRCSVLTAMESLALCPLSSTSQQDVAIMAVQGLFTHIKQEVHTATAVTAIGVLGVWCRLLPPRHKETLEFIEGSLSKKTTPPLLRVAYMQCVLALCQQDAGDLSLLPLPRQSLERVSFTPSPQPAALEEGVVAMHILIKISYPDPIPAEVWSLADSHSQHFVSTKLISAASSESLLVLVQVAQALLSADDCKLRDDKEWLRGVVSILLQCGWQQRQAAAKCLTAVVTLKPVLAEWLLDDLVERTNKESFPAKPLLLALKSLATPTHPKKEMLAVKSLLIAHHPAIVAVEPNSWMEILKRLKLDPSSFLSSSSRELTSILISNMADKTQACLLALHTLLVFGERAVTPVLMDEVCNVLGNQEVVTASTDGMEIMNTPQGQLWHKGMKTELNAALTGGPVTTANMKKESKAYSFEDQKWEIEMRQEILRKKKAESEDNCTTTVHELLKKAKLSQKQKQNIELQLADEEATRSRYSQFKEQLDHLVTLSEALEGAVLLPHIPRLSQVTYAAFGSPLARLYCRRLWGTMSRSVLQDWNIAELYAETSFNILTSGRSSALMRVCSLLKEHLPSTLDLNSARHTLMLPFLQHILTSHDSKVISHDLKETATTILNDGVSKYISGIDKDPTSFDPQLFPGVKILQLLSAIIASDESLKMMKIKKSCMSMFVSLLPPFCSEALPLLTSDLLHASGLLRRTVLQGLGSIPPQDVPSDPQLLVGILIAMHDQDEDNRKLATDLWDATGFSNSLTSDLSSLLIQHCSGSNLVVQNSSALGLGVWLEKYPKQMPQILDQLLSTYNDKNTTPPPTKDSFGREIYVEYQDPWECRVGVAKALEQLSKAAKLSDVMKFFKFVIPLALSDKNAKVRSAMMSAAQEAISSHGNKLAGDLMAHSEECLKSIPDSHEADTVRQSIIVLMGSLAKHLDKGNPKVKAVVHLLLGNLDTPSQQVQEAIAGCLPPLASVIKSEAEEVIKKLLEKLLESTSYSQRRGASYGLAGLIKGLGIPTLKQFQVMGTLQDAIKNKKNYRYREGALFAFQSLCNMLGRLFEPYVVHLLPDLLVCFGDGNQYVREATDQTARTIMAHLSSHGVKLILPSLLTALEEDSWRTKAGSAELLGSMAFCAPKQLSSCLPSIVPRLMDILADSHSKVQAAGSQALKQIGSVIKNPEIQELVPVLLEALSDPSNKPQTCLQVLLETEFVHVIDPPSLALIMPTLKRTLEVRSTDTKKMAAQIIGNMYSLTDKKDLAPYLPEVLPGLKKSLVDPVPEVRTACAKALGAIARGMGDEGLKELLPWLTATLQSETTSVDRSGAAQGISEVLFSQGVECLKNLMPQFVATSQDASKSPHIRDGYLMLFVYLPMTFGELISSFIGDLLPPILLGLADESEFIRETALQAGQTIVHKYADTAVEVFLPQLENGLFNENWRIRCSSIQLLGDLLYKISGLSGKMSTESEEDDNFGTEAAHQVLLNTLGKERRDRVLAGLYMGRSDVALIVRQTSLHVWKVVVTNTARTLREILPTLVQLLLNCLASKSHDKRKVAARTLGDLVRKLGERVLPEVIPMLERGLNSESTQERQGVCVGLSEIIQQTSRDHVLLYMDSLLPTVQNALCDKDPAVRTAAAMTFDSLHSTIGPRILDEVLSPLLLDLSAPSSEQSEVALDGLKQVMAVKSRVVLPHIVPQLIQPPVNIRALALLTSVAGEALNKHLNRIIPALILALKNTSQEEGVWQSAKEVVLSVNKEPGPAFLIEELVKCCRDTCPEVRGVAMGLLQTLCSRTTADLSEHTPHLLIFTTESLNDPSDQVCQSAWLALDAIIKRVNQKELPHLTGYLHKALRTVSANLIGEELHGFGLKGITPALTLLKEGLINGSPDEKEEAARVLVEVIHLASPKTLSSGKVVMLIAGPLIRVLGDRYGWNVKVATLEALVELVRKVGVAAKAFIPQLQTSYLKALNDPHPPVRIQAVTGLTELVPLSPRVDPVFNDLHNGIKKNEEPGLRVTMLQALQGVIKVEGRRMSEKHREEILSTLITLQATAHEGHRLAAGQCVGSLCAYLSDTQLQNTLATCILDQDGISDWAVLQARAATISAALLVASSRIVALGMRDVVAKCIVSLATSDRVPVCESGLRSVASFINHVEGNGKEMIPPLSQGLTHSSLDTKIVACDVCAELQTPSDFVLSAVLPLLLQNSKEKNTALKAAAELALYKLIHGNTHLKHVSGLLDATIARKLEETYSKIQARHSRN